MKVVFRTDASTAIGSGHVMRCLTLAQRLREDGAEIAFICRRHAGNLNALITSRGFALTELQPPAADAAADTALAAAPAHASWLGVSAQVDAQQTQAALGVQRPDWLIVDHYGIERAWQTALRPHVGRIMVIDDLADRSHDCDLLLDQNLAAGQQERYRNLVPSACRQLLGPQFSLLQPTYAALHPYTAAREGEIRSILVFYGGVDLDHLTVRTVQAFLALERADVALDVVVGAACRDGDAIRQLAASNRQIRVHSSLPSLAPLMFKADLFVGAGGGVSWERLCLGLPAILVTVADNQTALAQQLVQRGLVDWLGNAAKVGVPELQAALKRWIAKGAVAGWFPGHANFVDGRGSERVVHALRDGATGLDASPDMDAGTTAGAVVRRPFATAPARASEDAGDHPRASEVVGDHDYTVLVTSISRKIGLLKRVKDACARMPAKVALIGADTNPDAMGRYFCDAFWQMPPAAELDLDTVAAFCQSRRVKLIVPSRDGELPFWSGLKPALAALGVSVLISDSDGIAVCLDKLAFSRQLIARGLPAIPSSLEINELANAGNFVVKERYGAGSISLAVNVDKAAAYAWSGRLNDPLFQPFIAGTEYSVDLYVDRNGKAKGAICRTRDLVINGESQITTAADQPVLAALSGKMAEALRLYGHVVVQAIGDADGNFHIIECNSRFGGASTLAVECGLDSFFWALQEANGASLDAFPFVPATKAMRQVRYPADMYVEAAW